MFQIEIEDASRKKKASATILYRNPNPVTDSQNLTCKDMCSKVTTKLSMAVSRTDERITALINITEISRVQKVLEENVQVGTLIDTIIPLISMRQSAVMLYFGCTTRTNGNDHDMRAIATDMQPFNCSNMPPNGDGPGSFHSNIE